MGLSERWVKHSFITYNKDNKFTVFLCGRTKAVDAFKRRIPVVATQAAIENRVLQADAGGDAARSDRLRLRY